MKQNGFLIVYALVVVFVIAVCVLLTKAVIESDLPMWLKWIILK